MLGKKILKRLCLMLAVLFIGSLCVAKQPKGFHVSDVSVIVTPSSFHGLCPQRFMFAGKITGSGKGRVKCRWLRSDGNKSPVMFLDFTEAGAQIITTSWTIGDTGKNYANFWGALQILSPTAITSNKAYFQLKCVDNPDQSTDNDIDVSDIYLDDQCSLMIKHTNRSQKHLNIILKENIWLNGILVYEANEAVDLPPGASDVHNTGKNSGIIIDESASVRVMIDVDNLLKETDEVNNLLVKRVHCIKQ